MGLFLAALGATAVPASAHVGVDASTTEAGRTAVVRLRIGHGCDGSPTTEVRVRIPDGIRGARPEAAPGWDVETVVGPVTPYDSHGERITEGVTEVRWSGGRLPDDQFAEFGLSVGLPDAAGTEVWFPTVQTCEQGEHRWIEIPVEGGAEPKSPAPGLVVTAAADAARPAGGVGSAVDDDDGLDALALAALGVGALAAVLAGAALVVARRPRP